MSPPDRFHYVDQEARDLANRAIALIEAHERVCVEQANRADDWRNNAAQSLQRIESGVATQFKSISDQVSGVYTRIWWAAGGIMAAMFTVIMFLLQKH